MRKARNQDQKMRHSWVAWKRYRRSKGAPAGSSLRYSSCRMKYNTIHPLSLQMWNWQVLTADYGWWPESMPLIPRNNCIYIQCDGLFLSHSQPLVTPGAHSPAAAKLLQSCLTLWPHRWQPTRLPRPWDSPGKNTGVGCHFLLQCMKVKSESEVAQSCLTLRDPMDCSPPGSSVHAHP